MNIDDFTKDLILDDGIWYSKNRTSISYPEDGNEICFQIEEDSFWFKHRNDCLIEVLKNFPPGGLFFDIGGGNGCVSRAIEDSGYETVLVEPGINGILNSRRRGLKNLVCSAIGDAGFESRSIPAIGLFDVVEHFESDMALLRTCHDLLKPHGRLYITVPAYRFLWCHEDSDAGHYNRYTTKSLSRILSTVGFEVEYSTYIFSILPLPIFLFRTVPCRLGFNKKSDGLTKRKSEHGRKSMFLDWFLGLELKRISQKKKVQFGSSCLIVARKNQTPWP